MAIVNALICPPILLLPLFLFFLFIFFLFLPFDTPAPAPRKNMSLSLIVAFLRNFLCCLVDCSFSSPFHLFGVPILKVMISITQFYAMVTMMSSGYANFSKGIRDYKEMARVLSDFMAFHKPDSSWDTIALASLRKAMKETLLLTVVSGGVCEFCIGGAFFWLGVNSLGLIDMIGGIKGVVDSLLVAEVALIPCIFGMLYEWNEGRRRVALKSWLEAECGAAKGAKGSIKKRSIKKNTFKNTLKALEPYDVITVLHWTPRIKWNSFLDSKVKDRSDLLIRYQVEDLHECIDRVYALRYAPRGSLDRDNDNENDHENDANLKREKVENLMKFIYVVLNVLAFHGYSLCVYCYYLGSGYAGEATTTTIGGWLYWYKYGGMEDGEAEEWGNFVGDLCWAVEPALLLNQGRIVRFVCGGQEEEKKVEEEEEEEEEEDVNTTLKSLPYSSRVGRAVLTPTGKSGKTISENRQWVKVKTKDGQVGSWRPNALVLKGKSD